MTDEQHKGQNKKDKRTNNNLQDSTLKYTDWETQAPLKLRGRTGMFRTGKLLKGWCESDVDSEEL